MSEHKPIKIVGDISTLRHSKVDYEASCPAIRGDGTRGLALVRLTKHGPDDVEVDRWFEWNDLFMEQEKL